MQSGRLKVSSRRNESHNFLILIPAHNEEHLLPDLLESLNRLDYPKNRYAVHVVADNCTDQTAAVAHHGGARVHIRTNHEKTGKGYALNWLINRIHESSEPYDAVVFFDADSIVSPNFLQAMACHLDRGERAIQAYYAVRGAELSWVGSLRYAALAVLHFLRPQGRMHLGTSVGLKGNGMVFSADLLSRNTWSSSITEDIDLHMALLLSGERVTFAPEAVVCGEMPNKLSDSVTQHMRWEKGKKQLARKYIPRLLATALHELAAGCPRRAFALVDAVMEFIEPPFSVLFGANLFSLALSVVLAVGLSIASPLGPTALPVRLMEINILLAIILLLGQGFYLLVGLRLVSAPKQVYRSLLYAPLLMIWKTWQMILVLLGKDQNDWVRTRRNEG